MPLIRRALAGALVGTAIAASQTWAGEPVPTPIGVTREYRLPAAGAAVRSARPVGRFICTRTSPLRFRLHVELFARRLVRIWGQPLSPHRLAGFRSDRPLLAFVNGRRFRGDPRSIPLRRHAEVVLEIGGYVAPHRSYLFPALAR